MSIQWTLVASFLYAEMGICLLLLVPFISATRWRNLFRSRAFSIITSYANVYFTVFVVILAILFVDSIRNVRRFSTPPDPTELHMTPGAEDKLHMKMFRAQRDFYISGFALFLILVLRRLITLLSNQATLQAGCEAFKKQAESATAMAKQLLEDNQNKMNEKGETKFNKELEVIKEEKAKLKTELDHSLKDLEAMKEQAKSTAKEYDRLLEEHRLLQEKIKLHEGKTDSKKDE